MPDHTRAAHKKIRRLWPVCLLVCLGSASSFSSPIFGFNPNQTVSSRHSTHSTYFVPNLRSGPTSGVVAVYNQNKRVYTIPVKKASLQVHFFSPDGLLVWEMRFVPLLAVSEHLPSLWVYQRGILQDSIALPTPLARAVRAQFYQDDKLTDTVPHFASTDSCLWFQRRDSTWCLNSLTHQIELTKRRFPVNTFKIKLKNH